MDWHGSSPPPNFTGGPLKISDQNNWGGTEQKIKFGGGAKFKGEPKILGMGYAMNPNNVMVVMLKDILLYLLGFRFINIVYIS